MCVCVCVSVLTVCVCGWVSDCVCVHMSVCVSVARVCVYACLGSEPISPVCAFTRWPVMNQWHKCVRVCEVCVLTLRLPLAQVTGTSRS